MDRAFAHIPVMPKEAIEFLNPQKGGVYVDGTLGGGGHTALIADIIGAQGRIIGVDRDIDAISAAKKRLKKYTECVTYVHNNFKNIDIILDDLDINEVDGILLDLGVSSEHLDNLDRGFSFKESEENLNVCLDMRMDTSQELTAYDVVNKYPEIELREIFYRLGEERYAKSIARRIVLNRPIETIETLVQAIKSATPPSYRYRKSSHYASKVFRAIRMEVNQELPAVEEVIPKAISKLKKGGRLVIISFHSLEDRIVKHSFRKIAADSKIAILTKKPVVPGEKELQENSRSRSAKLRVIEKLC